MPCRVLNLNKTVGWGEALHILDARNQADPALEGAVKDIIARVAAEGDVDQKLRRRERRAVGGPVEDLVGNHRER